MACARAGWPVLASPIRPGITAADGRPNSNLSYLGQCRRMAAAGNFVPNVHRPCAPCRVQSRGRWTAGCAATSGATHGASVGISTTSRPVIGLRKRAACASGCSNYCAACLLSPARHLPRTSRERIVNAEAVVGVALRLSRPNPAPPRTRTDSDHRAPRYHRRAPRNLAPYAGAGTRRLHLLLPEPL